MTKPKAIFRNSKGEKTPRKKIPKRITESYLHNSGLYYLERYHASSGHFRTVMLRKVKKSCMHHTDQNYEECAKLVNHLVEKFVNSGLLNDDLYLQGMIASFRRKGLSKRMIMQKLITKKLDSDQIERYLQKHDEEVEAKNPELKSAAIMCRKKKLGSYATSERDLQKELAKLGRAGFTYETSRKILEMDKDEVEDLIYS